MQTIRKNKEAYYREIKLNELGELINIFRIVYNGTYPDIDFRDIEKLKSKILRAEIITFVAEVEGQIVGAISFKKINESNIMLIYGAVVLKKYRKKNLFKKLFLLSMDTVITNYSYFDTYLTQVRAESDFLINFLIRDNGFFQIGRLDNAHYTYQYESFVLLIYINNNSSKVKQYLELKNRDSFRVDLDKNEFLCANNIRKQIISKHILCDHRSNFTYQHKMGVVDLYINQFDSRSYITNIIVFPSMLTEVLNSMIVFLKYKTETRYVDLIIDENDMLAIQSIIKSNFNHSATIPSFDNNEIGVKYLFSYNI